MMHNADNRGSLRRPLSHAADAARPAGLALAVAIALAGCSAGQVAETAIIRPPISGLNTQSADGNLLIRNLQVLYTGPAGYPAGGTAPLQVSLYNQTEQPMTVVIRSGPATDAAQPGSVSAQQIALTGGTAAASPSANPEPTPGDKTSPHADPSATEVIDPSGPPSTPQTPGASLVPSAADGQPARLTIPALSSASFQPNMPGKLLAVGLSGQLAPGRSLSLVLERDGVAPMTLLAPMEVPLSPAPRSSGTPPEKNLGEDQ